jgi:hypothetical protein
MFGPLFESRVFLSRLSDFMIFFCGYDLSRLQQLLLSSSPPLLRPFDQLALHSWLDQLDPSETAVLLLCPAVVARSEHLQVAHTGLRILSLRPNILHLSSTVLCPFSVDGGTAGGSTRDQLVEVVVELQGGSSEQEAGRLTLTLTDQRDAGRTLVFGLERSPDGLGRWQTSIEEKLLRPRNEEDATVYDVFVVVDHNFRSQNRKTMTVIPQEDDEDQQL